MIQKFTTSCFIRKNTAELRSKELTMTQKFTTPCFIRKNTVELRKKLEELGYEPTKIIFDNERLCIATAVNGQYAKYTNISSVMFDSTNPYETWNCAGRIDCGTNEDLFLALAALREDTDKGQWFCPYDYYWSNHFFICKYDTIKEHINKITNGDGVSYKDFHKATVKELIVHFKD